MTGKLASLLVLGLLCSACGSETHNAAGGPASPKRRGFVLAPPVVAPAFALRDPDGRYDAQVQASDVARDIRALG